jgi:hypothetical protein
MKVVRHNNGFYLNCLKRKDQQIRFTQVGAGVCLSHTAVAATSYRVNQGGMVLCLHLDLKAGFRVVYKSRRVEISNPNFYTAYFPSAVSDLLTVRSKQ